MPMTRKRPSRVSTYVGPPPLAGLAQECCSDLHWFRRADERTRTAYPCSSYEFACAHSSLFYCVRFLAYLCGF